MLKQTLDKYRDNFLSHLDCSLTCNTCILSGAGAPYFSLALVWSLHARCCTGFCLKCSELLKSNIFLWLTKPELSKISASDFLPDAEIRSYHEDISVANAIFLRVRISSAPEIFRARRAQNSGTRGRCAHRLRDTQWRRAHSSLIVFSLPLGFDRNSIFNDKILFKY